MKRTRIIYWILTGLFAFLMLGSAIPDIAMADMAVKGFAEIGLPAALLPFVGIAKLLGVIAILIPGYPRIKEWAYAGLTFDLAGAAYLIAMSGKSFENWVPVVIFIALALASYYYYHQKLKAAKLSQVNQKLPANASSPVL